MRLIKALLGLLFIALGVLFGAMNRAPVRIEFGFLGVDTHLGISLLAAVLVGALLAGMVLTAAVIWPLRLRLRRGAVPADTVSSLSHD